jgi:Zn-dependent protease with chaperone function
VLSSRPSQVLDEYKDVFETKKAQFSSILRASNLDPVVLQVRRLSCFLLVALFAFSCLVLSLSFSLRLPLFANATAASLSSSSPPPQTVTRKLDDVLTAKNEQVDDLQYECAKVAKAHNDLVRSLLLCVLIPSSVCCAVLRY